MRRKIMQIGTRILIDAGPLFVALLFTSELSAQESLASINASQLKLGERFLEMNQMHKKHEITTIGAAVLDIHTYAFPSQSRGDKRDGDLDFQLGGAAANVAKAAATHAAVKPILMTGDDTLGKIIEELAQNEFKEASVCYPMMHSTRCSIISGNSIITKRSSAKFQNLPKKIQEICSSSDMLIVAPMTQKDFELTRQILKSNSNSILQLSKQQLENSGMSIQLAQMAGVTIINESEAAFWTGYSDPVQAIQWLRDRCVENVIVTSKNAVNGFCSGNWIFQTAFQVKKVKCSVGCGDVFTGTLASMRVNGKSWEEAVTLSMTAATLHLEKSAVTDSSQLYRESSKRKRVPFQITRPKAPTISMVNRMTVAASSLIVGFSFGLLM